MSDQSVDKEFVWQQAKYTALLTACSESISRARYVFIIINVAGITALGGLFNATIPWLRNTIERAATSSPRPDHLAHIQHTMYEDLWTLTIPLLGSKFSVFDLSVITATTLVVLALWQYYCVRRENQVVHIVVEEATAALKESKECARYLYHAVAHQFVFTTKLNTHVPADLKPTVGPSWAVQVLLFMPAWVPTLMALSDVFTAVVPQKLGIDPKSSLWLRLSDSEHTEVVLRVIYALVLAFMCFRLCKRSLEFDTATRKELDELDKKLTSPS